MKCPRAPFSWKLSAGSDKKSKTERVVAPNPDGVAAMALAFERQEALRRMLVKS